MALPPLLAGAVQLTRADATLALTAALTAVGASGTVATNADAVAAGELPDEFFATTETE